MDGTYEREMFNDILKLVPMAESVDKLTSVCAMCSKDASFTLRCFDSSKNSSREKEEEDGPVELIGGAEMYKAACRKCYFAAMKGRRGDKRESLGEVATTEMTKTAKESDDAFGRWRRARHRLANANAALRGVGGNGRFTLVANTAIECDDQK